MQNLVIDELHKMTTTTSTNDTLCYDCWGSDHLMIPSSTNQGNTKDHKQNLRL